MSKNANIGGIGSITSGEYDAVKIEGVGKVKGNVVCSSLTVDGLLKGKGKIDTGSFVCDGAARIFRNIKARTVRIDGILKLRRAKLEADLIECDGVVVCNKEISADEVNINGMCSVVAMYGDKVTIKNRASGLKATKIPNKILPLVYAYFGRRISLTHSIVDTLECTELYAENLKAGSVKAHNAILGENCEIGKIECSGELKYSESCKLEKITAQKSSMPYGGGVNMSNMSLVKILDLYKNRAINANEAEQMISSVAGEACDTACESSLSFPDDKLRILVMRGSKLITKQEYLSGAPVKIEYPGEALDVECWGDLSCGNVLGNARAGGKVSCGDIKGSLSCGGSVSCKSAAGNIAAGGGVRISKE